jgi:hypothetical protein
MVAMGHPLPFVLGIFSCWVADLMRVEMPNLAQQEDTAIPLLRLLLLIVCPKWIAALPTMIYPFN